MSESKLSTSISRILFLGGLSVILFSCQFGNDKKKEQIAENTDPELNAAELKTEESKSIKIVTNSMEFITKDEYPPGWNTFKYENNSNETHFVLFEKYPEGKGVEDGEREVAPVYQEAMDLINEGKVEEGFAAFAKLPEWYKKVEFLGGTGLISPKSTAQSSFFLEPGTYIIECYVKMPNGSFHVNQGMVKEINVPQGAPQKLDATADHTIAIGIDKGISIDGPVRAGEKTFKVNYGKQKLHESNLMHDVHLVWMEAGSDINVLNKWMNVATPEGLQTPAPAGFKFLGGVQEMPTGSTGYFTADLKPGNYVLISEIPDPKGKGLIKEFTVK